MFAIITLLILSAAGVAYCLYWGDHDLILTVSVVILVGVGSVWGMLTLMNIHCESLGESYREEVRYDWATGCMLPLENDREIQIDEDSIALVVRELLEDQ